MCDSTRANSNGRRPVDGPKLGFGSGGPDFWHPHFRGTSSAVGVLVAAKTTGFLEHRQRAVDLSGSLVAAEKVADFRAADAVRTVFRERPDLVNVGSPRLSPKIQRAESALYRHRARAASRCGRRISVSRSRVE
jgi:hypothetical protein